MISSSAGDQDGALADIAISNRAAEHMHAAPNTDDMPLHRFPIATLLELCRYHAMNRPSSAAYAWLNAQEVETLCLTYAELDRRARCIGAQMAAMGLGGKNVLLLYDSGLDFVVAFLGGIYGGAVVVPAYPPHPNEGAERIARIAADCDAAAILTESAISELISALARSDATLSRLAVVPTDTLPSELASQWVDPKLDASSIAFLQYTSGSTGTPKGVQVSHGNILANQEMIRRGFGHSAKTVFVGWLPLHHDMGLVGNVLQPLYLGIPSVLMAPRTFIQKPVRWLRAISRYRATTSGSPNFGYELCARKVTDEELAHLDLSSWQVAYNGAEPIRADTLDRFASRFARCGFQRRTLYPCYGMAEATLFVTGGLAHAEPITLHVDAAALEVNRIERREADAPETRALVGCGRPWLNERILIVDPETRLPLASDQVGEIWISGPNVSRGYLNRPALNRETFEATLASGEGPFLRTGDLGFLHNGELFVTGRIKDLIIIRGRNYYPQDIEQTVGGVHPAFRSGGTAVFLVEADGAEQVAVVQEISARHLPAIEAAGDEARTAALRAVRRRVADAHGITVHGCVFVPEGSIPKTSSGKIRRRACAALYHGASLAPSAWSE